MVFKKGDIVRLKKGRSPIVVSKVGSFYLEGFYIATGSESQKHKHEYVAWNGKKDLDIFLGYIGLLKVFNNAQGFILDLVGVKTDQQLLDRLKEINTNGDNDDMTNSTPKTNQLFQVGDKDQYGTYVATNSKGMYVLEMKGKDGDVKTFDPKDLTKVVPYSVEFKSFSSENNYVREVNKDAGLKVGDIVVHQGKILQVDSLDTGQEAPNKFADTVVKLTTEVVFKPNS